MRGVTYIVIDEIGTAAFDELEVLRGCGGVHCVARSEAGLSVSG